SPFPAGSRYRGVDPAGPKDVDLGRGAHQRPALRASLSDLKELDNERLTSLTTLRVDQQQCGTGPAPTVVANAIAIVAARSAARISFLINLTSSAPSAPGVGRAVKFEGEQERARRRRLRVHLGRRRS